MASGTQDSGTPFDLLHLDPAFAAFYGLPAAVPFRFPSHLKPGVGNRIDHKDLASGLEEAGRMAGRFLDPGIRRFLSHWPLMEQLDRYLSIGNFTFARRVAGDLMSLAPELPCAAFGAGVSASRLGDLDEALAHLERCASDCPRHAPALEELALALALAERWDGALLTLDRLEAVDLGLSTCHLIRSSLERRDRNELRQLSDFAARLKAVERTGDAEATVAIAQEFTAHFPENAEAHRRCALAARAAGDLGRALSLARRAARLDSRSPLCQLALARLSVEAGDFIEAERAALRAKTLAPHWPASGLAHASVLSADGRPSQAGAVLAEALKTNPEDLTLMKFFAASLLETGRPKKAVEVLGRVLARESFDPAAHFNVGRACEAAGEVEAAEAAYESALRRSPRFAEAIEAYAVLIHDRGRAAEARAVLGQLVREQPESPYGYRGLGDLVLNSDPVKAAQYYATAGQKKLGFVCAGAYYLAGLKSLLNREHSEACRLFEVSVRADPRRHRAWCNLGVARFRSGRLGEAIEAMEQATRIDPLEPGYRRNLAAFYKAAFWRHPWKNFHFLGLARKARRREKDLSART